MTTSPTPMPARYARWRETSLGRITERVEIGVVLDLAGALARERVLDVGTGDGTYAIEAAAHGALATGVDLEPKMLDAARARAAERGVEVALRQGRAEALPFGDATFDIVIGVTLLCLVSDARLAVHEMARVLAPGGRLVIGELGRFSAWAAQRRVRGWLGDETWHGARFWSRRDLVRLVEDAGLEVASLRGSVFYPPSGLAARLLSPLEPLLTRARTPGAAFIAVSATTPRR